MVKLFIGGFPPAYGELEVVQLVAPYADVVTIKLVRDKVTRKCKGYGFIEIAEAVRAHNAIGNLHGVQMGDRELSLNIVREEKPGPVQRKAVGEKPKRPRRPRL